MLSSLGEKNVAFFGAGLLPSVSSHELLIPFPKELDGQTSESLPEPQSLLCLDLNELEPRLEDTIVDLGHYGMCLCHLSSGCLSGL